MSTCADISSSLHVHTLLRLASFAAILLLTGVRCPRALGSRSRILGGCATRTAAAFRTVATSELAALRYRLMCQRATSKKRQHDTRTVDRFPTDARYFPNILKITFRIKVISKTDQKVTLKLTHFLTASDQTASVRYICQFVTFAFFATRCQKGDPEKRRSEMKQRGKRGAAVGVFQKVVRFLLSLKR